jgi:LuxR family maltose regulon positive regulatory protein
LFIGLETLQAPFRFERALTLAEPEGYMRTFVDEGEAMQLLISDFRLTIAPRAHPLLGYVDRILDFFPQPTENRFESKIVNPKPKMIEPLTDRELEVLRLIAEGHSNAEISQRLYLALSTVKGHNLRIFNKLRSKPTGVVRARELGLL